MENVPAYIGIGSNLDDPTAQVRLALERLEKLPATELKQASSLYQSPPMGPQDQPSYINAAALLITKLPCIELLNELQGIERQHGRDRSTEHWGPRTLDLDILLYGEQTFETRRLKVPHPGISERPFVIVPLAEIDPKLILPNGQCASVAASQFSNADVERLVTPSSSR